MNDNRSTASESQQDFDRDFKAWAIQPPKTTPPEARAQLAARLAEAGRSPLLFDPRVARQLAAAAIALALGASWWAWSPRNSDPPPAASVELPPLGENVVLLWLDAETPLYLTMTPPSADEETHS